MRRSSVLTGMLIVSCLASAAVARGEHRSPAQLRSQVEVNAALLDSHTRRLYYEIRGEAEGNDAQDQLLSDARELWRAARSLNDRALDGASSSRLEREVRRVEEAFHDFEERLANLRRARTSVPPLRKRVQRINELVHRSHEGVHELLDREAAAQASQAAAQPTPTNNYGYRNVEPVPRLQELEQRAADVVDPPAVRVGPDGFYFDGRRFTIPFGR